MSSRQSSPLRIGLVGLGLTGSFHRERIGLRDDLRVVALYDSAPEVRQAFRDGKDRLHESWPEFLADPDIDAIWIATPPATHATLGVEALESGRTVIVEPPLALNAADGQRLIAAAQRANKSLIVAHTRRWDEDFQQARELVRAGGLGEVLSLRRTCWSYNPPHLRRRRVGEVSWRDGTETGGGLLWEFGTHFFDQLLDLVGAVPEHVYARATAPGQSVDEGFVAVVGFPQGVTATLDVSRTALAPLNSGWEIAGTAGSFAGGILFTATPEGEVEDIPLPAATIAADPFYTALVGHLRDGQPHPAPAAPSLLVVKLIEAVRRSTATGQRAFL